MNQSSEMKAAQDKIDSAVREFVQACKECGEAILSESALLSGYILILEGIHYDEEGGSKTSLGVAYDGGDMRLSAAVGLCQLTQDMLRGIGSPEDG